MLDAIPSGSPQVIENRAKLGAFGHGRPQLPYSLGRRVGQALYPRAERLVVRQREQRVQEGLRVARHEPLQGRRERWWRLKSKVRQVFLGFLRDALRERPQQQGEALAPPGKSSSFHPGDVRNNDTSWKTESRPRWLSCDRSVGEAPLAVGLAGVLSAWGLAAPLERELRAKSIAGKKLLEDAALVPAFQHGAVNEGCEPKHGLHAGSIGLQAKVRSAKDLLRFLGHLLNLVRPRACPCIAKSRCRLLNRLWAAALLRKWGELCCHSLVKLG
eukprot:scaffold1220_cov259-Pinguiococcus_pyrenoidosus.AAC.15